MEISREDPSTGIRCWESEDGKSLVYLAWKDSVARWPEGFGKAEAIQGEKLAVPLSELTLKMGQIVVFHE